MWRICIDHLPPSLNAWYAGSHWSKRKETADTWHGLMLAAFVDAKLPKPLKWPVSLNVTEYCKGNVRDSDASCVAAKLCGDSLVAHGYLPDDSPEYVSHVVLRCEKGKVNKTVITILSSTHYQMSRE